MSAPAFLAHLPPIARRVAAGVAAALRDGLEPASLYLSADDKRALEEAWTAEGFWMPGEPYPATFGGLDLRETRGRNGSRIYCRGGICRAVPRRAPAEAENGR